MWLKRPAISCFSLIDSAMYVYAHQDQFASCHKVAMSLYNITELLCAAYDDCKKFATVMLICMHPQACIYVQ